MVWPVLPQTGHILFFCSCRKGISGSFAGGHGFVVGFGLFQVEAVGYETVEGPAEYGDDGAVGHGFKAGGVACIEAVEGSDESDEFRGFQFAAYMVYSFHDDYHGSHAEEVGHDVGNDCQVDQSLKLFVQGGADGHKGEEGLNDGDGHHAGDGSAVGSHFLQEGREVSFIAACLEYVGNGELPAQEGTEAGENHEAHDDLAYGAAKHLGEYEAEGSGAGDENVSRNDTEDNVGGNDVAGCCQQGAAENGFRHVLFRIIHGVRIGAGRFHTQESPQGHGDGVQRSFTEAQVMDIPVSGVHGGGEPEPAYESEADTGNDNAPYGDRGNLAGVLGAAEVKNGSQPEGEDSGSAGHDRVQSRIQETQGIAYGGNGNGGVRKNQGHPIGVVGKEIAGLAEGIFSIAAHAAAFFTVHAALGKYIGQSHGSHGRYQPGNDGQGAHLSQFGRQHDNAGTHHIDGCQDGELENAHFVCFTHVDLL